jgi:hypothetical protein
VSADGARSLLGDQVAPVEPLERHGAGHEGDRDHDHRGPGSFCPHSLTRVLVTTILVTRVLVKEEEPCTNTQLSLKPWLGTVSSSFVRAPGQARGADAKSAGTAASPQAARHGAGWLLVDLGLRLATPRGTRSA